MLTLAGERFGSFFQSVLSTPQFVWGVITVILFSMELLWTLYGFYDDKFLKFCVKKRKTASTKKRLVKNGVSVEKQTSFCSYF